jgi:hypothetical protein
VSGERDLSILLRNLRPDLRPGRWVFTSAASIPAGARPVATVVEVEGVTMVLEEAEADRLGLAHDLVLSMITLRVHSALDAVGLTAAVSTALAGAGIGCNVIAGRFHDHLFVPVGDEQAALAVLAALGAG